MQIVEIRETEVPLSGGVSNAVISFDQHRVSLVAIITDQRIDGVPLVGLGFNSIGRHGQGGILRDRMIPRVLAAAPDDLLDPHTGLIDPASVATQAMQQEKPGGHGDRASAAAALELACWDLIAKVQGEPAYRAMAAAAGRPNPVGHVPVYAAGGYYAGGEGGSSRGLATLLDEIRGYLDDGYTAVKIKIGGAALDDDLRRVEAVVDLIGSGAQVAVDANGRFTVEEALRYSRELAPLGLRWLEEPVDPLDYAGLDHVAQEYGGAMATGENLFSVQDVSNLLTFGGLRPGRDVLQMDAGLSYGLTEYLKMVERVEAHGFPRTALLPHGGHLINLHVVAALGLGGCEAYPGVFQPFGGYSDACVVVDGYIRPPESPGFGLEQKSGLSEYIQELVA